MVVNMSWPWDSFTVFPLWDDGVPLAKWIEILKGHFPGSRYYNLIVIIDLRYTNGCFIGLDYYLTVKTIFYDEVNLWPRV